MPLIKQNLRGKPLNVSFERFSNGHKFFTELKSNKNKVSESWEFNRFMTNYLSVSNQISSDDAQKKTLDESKVPQAVRSF